MRAGVARAEAEPNRGGTRQGRGRSGTERAWPAWATTGDCVWQRRREGVERGPTPRRRVQMVAVADGVATGVPEQRGRVNGAPGAPGPGGAVGQQQVDGEQLG